MPKLSRRAWLRQQIERQREWIDQHGGGEAGYVEYYGSKQDEDHYGDGGELIYAADRGVLDAFEQQLGRIS